MSETEQTTKAAAEATATETKQTTTAENTVNKIVISDNAKNKILCVVKVMALAIGLINLYLSAKGEACIQFDSAATTQTVTLVYTLCVTAWSVWKNFSWTGAAQQSDTLLKALKKGDTETISSAYTTISDALADVKSLIDSIGAIGKADTGTSTDATGSGTAQKEEAAEAEAQK